MIRNLFRSFANLRRFFYWIDLYLYRKFVYRKFPVLLFIGFLIAVLSISACYIKSTPEKIYGIREKIITLADSLKGIKYIYGGTDIYGFDCSGFVFYVFDSFGVKIPRTAKKQGQSGKKIKLSRAATGDILIFKLKKSWHSGILKKKGNIISFIHAPNKRGEVREEILAAYWLKRLKYTIKLL